MATSSRKRDPVPPCLTAGRLSPLMLDRAMHIHIQAAGLTRRQIDAAPVTGLWPRLLQRLRALLG